MATRIRYSAVPFKERKNENTPPDDGKKSNILSMINPELAKEWHPTMNGELTPDMVTAGSHKNIWWIGKCGHEWRAWIKNRVSGTGCPYCAGKKVLKGFNDLKTTEPDLSMEWHPTKNKSNTPEMFTRSSNKKVWWIGKCGHEWSATINSRSQGSGCPICKSEYKTSFAEQTIYYYVKKIFPDAVNRDTSLEKELDIFIQSIKTAVEYDGRRFHTNIKRDEEKNAWCQKNGIRLIRVREKGCPLICDNDVIIRDGQDDDSLNKAIIKVLYLLGANYCSIDVKKDRVDIYNQYIKTKKDNSFAIKYPQIFKEWHPTKNQALTPEMITAKSGKMIWWMCKNNHEWTATISHRIRGQGCPYCAGRISIKGLNDLSITNPSLASEWHPIKNGNLKPDMFKHGSQKKVWWKCKEGHEWAAIICNRSSGKGCPYCANRKTLQGFNDIATLQPELAAEWHPTKNGKLTPDMVTVGSGKKVWWKCKEGHEWQAIIYNRIGRSQCCPICARQKRKV